MDAFATNPIRHRHPLTATNFKLIHTDKWVRHFFLVLCLLLTPLASSWAKPSSAKLIITSDITCQHQSGPDRMLSTQTI
ncbi:MAG: hypothetical protein OQK80_12495, partial [Sedimenticola sp.]|nr:hypothetical protein [Sedimenticola sp.]